jgi:hypothetical protein
LQAAAAPIYRVQVPCPVSFSLQHNIKNLPIFGKSCLSLNCKGGHVALKSASPQVYLCCTAMQT